MNKTIGLGKISKEDFNRLVRPHFPIVKLELDGATVQLSGLSVIAHSPSIGVPVEALGFFSFHYSASNVACKFGIPSHLVTGIYLPLSTKERDLETIAKILGEEAKKYSVKIIAGQTASYYGIKIPLITSTCIGEATRKIEKPKQGDKVLIINEIGGESIWLKELNEGINKKDWKQFTPLPTALNLQKNKSVKMMHDVSEGGLKGALLEIVEQSLIRIDISTEELIFAKGSQEIFSDILRGPSYGTLVVIVNKDDSFQVVSECRKLGIPSVIAGEIRRGVGLYIDGIRIYPQKRIDLDKIYGTYKHYY
jgi:hydrogenase expression/formation protein HypE